MWLLAATAQAHVPLVYIVGPDEDWCTIIEQAIGNDIVMLEPGEYTGPCAFTAKPANVAGEITTIQSLDPLDWAVFVGTTGPSVWSLSGERLLMLQIAFRDLPAVDVLEFGGIREMWVRDCTFTDVAGRAIAMTGPADIIRITDSAFERVATGIDLGCAGACPVSGIDVSDNLFVRGATGVVVDAGSGVVRDNVFLDGATGVRATGRAGVLSLTANFFATTGPAMAVVRGPVTAQANIAIGSPAFSAPGSEQQDVVVLANTLVAQGEVAVDLLDWGPGRGLVFHSNAVVGAFPVVDGVDQTGTIACADTDGCFTDAAAWDFYPPLTSPLRGAGVDDGAIGADYCGRVRNTPPGSGALEGYAAPSIGPLAPTFKDDQSCTLPDGTTGPTLPTETGSTDTSTASTTPTEPPASGCRCTTTSPGLSALLLPCLALVVRRSRWRQELGPRDRDGCLLEPEAHSDRSKWHERTLLPQHGRRGPDCRDAGREISAHVAARPRVDVVTAL